jgi:hypothetical protein
LYLEPDGQALDLDHELLLDLVRFLVHSTETRVSVVTQFTQLILQLDDPEKIMYKVNDEDVLV